MAFWGDMMREHGGLEAYTKADIETGKMLQQTATVNPVIQLL